MHAQGQDAVVAALADEVAPDFGRAVGGTVVAHDLDSILVALLNGVVDNSAFVVIDLNPILVQNHLVRVDLHVGTVTLKVGHLRCSRHQY